MRAFIAIDLPESIRGRLIEVSKEFSGAGIIPVKREALHITLHFIGEIDEQAVKPISDIISSVNIKPFEVSVNSLGYFTPEFVKVIYAKIPKGYGECVSIYRQIGDGLVKCGLKVEPDFVPHITIARVKKIGKKEGIISKIESYNGMEFGSFAVESIRLKRSVLKEDGPVYSDLYKFDL